MLTRVEYVIGAKFPVPNDQKSATMRLTTKTALALPGSALLILAGATGASAAENYDMKLTDTMGNSSGSSSTAQLTVDGDSLRDCCTNR